MASVDYDMELTEAEKNNFESQKSRLFKATIAVSVVYGAISLAIFGAIFTSDTARALLTGTLAPFTITFIIGMFLIIIWLVIEIKTFKPMKNAQVERDPFICPDYFKLERTPSDVLDIAPADLKGVMAYRCVPDNEIFDTSSQFATIPTFSGYGASNIVLDINTKLGNVGIGTTDKLTCKNIYPAMLHSKDMTRKDSVDEPNKYRCEFVGKNGCNTLAWTSVCPHPKE